MRPDYDRLLEIAETADLGKYELITPYGDDTYPLYFSKISLASSLHDVP